MKYQKLAKELGQSIIQGTYCYGQKIPSMRSIAKLRNVSMATVASAYQILEGKDLIEARARTGFFVVYNRQSHEAMSVEPEISRKSHSLSDFDDLMPEMLGESSNRSISQLGLSQLEPDLVAREELNRLTRKIVRSHCRELYEYPNPRGLPAMRRGISRLMLERGVNTSPDEIIVTNGCQEALWIALRCVASRGDTIAIQTPCYPGFLKILQSLQMKAIEIPTTSLGGLDIPRLNSVIRSHSIAAIYAMPNCSNPTGGVISEDIKDQLVKTAVENSIAIIEDDTNRDLHFGEEELSTLQSRDDNDAVLFCSSFSKTVSPAYRVGWLAPGAYHEKALTIKYTLNLSTPAEFQLVLAQFLAEGGYRKQIARLKNSLSQTVESMAYIVARNLPNAVFDLPKGGALLWIGLDTSIDSRKVRIEALKHGVSVAPGTLFSPTKSFSNYVRLGWSGKWNDSSERAVRTFCSVANNV